MLVAQTHSLTADLPTDADLRCRWSRKPLDASEIRPLLTADLDTVSVKAPGSAATLPIISNRLGAALTAEQATSVEYWVAQLRNSVTLAACMERLRAQYPAQRRPMALQRRKSSRSCATRIKPSLMISGILPP